MPTIHNTPYPSASTNHSPLTPQIFPPTEHAAYLTHGADQIYYVQHHHKPPFRALCLLLNPFPSERPHAYIPWVRWARHLAAQGFEVLRFDYRGTGESTGLFHHMTFSLWLEDILLFTRFLRAQNLPRPLILHGLGLGALLASHAFAQNAADILSLWSPPKTGTDVLSEALRRRVMIDYVTLPPDQRQTTQHYIQQIENGQTLEVEGYRWSPQMWHDAKNFPLLLPSPSPQGGAPTPFFQIQYLDRHAEPLVAGLGQWRALNPRAQASAFPLNPPLTDLFTTNTLWLSQTTQLWTQKKSP